MVSVSSPFVSYQWKGLTHLSSSRERRDVASNHGAKNLGSALGASLIDPARQRCQLSPADNSVFLQIVQACSSVLNCHASSKEDAEQHPMREAHAMTEFPGGP